MVDVTLKTIDANLPQDCYVAMRIGDVQKLGRISSERMYKFPKKDVGEYRYGKIEVFQCVGRATVGVIPEDDAEQQVKVRFGDRELHFNLQLAASAEKIEPKIEEKPMFKPLKPKLEKARKYLKRHHLEARLKEVMSDVINELPEDPAEFIGRRLKENAGVVVPRQGLIDKQEASWLTFVAENIDYDAMMKNELATEVTTKVQQAIASEANNDVLPQDVIVKLAPGSVKIQALVHSTSPDLVFSTLSASQRLSAKLQENLSVINGIGDVSSAPIKIAHLRVRQRILQDKDSSCRLVIKELQRSDEELQIGDKVEVYSNSKQQWFPGEITKISPESKEPMVTVEYRSGHETISEEITTHHENVRIVGSQNQQDNSETNDEDLRQQAKQTLLNATSSGRLDEALAKVKESNSVPSDNDALRQQAKQTLLDATSTGRLDEALTKVKQTKGSQNDIESLREHAKQTLLAATASGELDDALTRVAKKNPAPDNEQLRQQAKQTLLDATATGKLDEALARVQQPKSAPPDSEELRQQAKKTLLDATSSGKLDEALARVQQPKSAPPDSEELRQEAMQKLLDATLSGRLEEALAKVQQPKSAPKDNDELRQEAMKKLLDATLSGRLDEALAKVNQPMNGPLAAPDKDSLREEAKQLLLDATSNGKLDEALAKGKKFEGPTSRTEELRKQAQQALLEATNSGKLDEALASAGNEAKAGDTELRSRIQDNLLQASRSGLLDEVLRNVSNSQALLKDQLKKSLLTANDNGQLEDALKNVVGDKSEEDLNAVRVQLKSTLFQASKDGRLEQALAEKKLQEADAAFAVGDRVEYYSDRAARWLPAVVEGRGDGFYKLNIKPRAEVSRLRKALNEAEHQAACEMYYNKATDAALDQEKALGKIEEEAPEVGSEDLELEALKSEARQKLRGAQNPWEIDDSVAKVHEATVANKDALSKKVGTSLTKASLDGSLAEMVPKENREVFTLQDASLTSPSQTTQEENKEQVVEKKKGRLSKHFKDFDHPQKGCCTIDQVRSVFKRLGWDKDVSVAEFTALEEFYSRGKDTFCYADFCSDVDGDSFPNSPSAPSQPLEIQADLSKRVAAILAKASLDGSLALKMQDEASVDSPRDKTLLSDVNVVEDRPPARDTIATETAPPPAPETRKVLDDGLKEQITEIVGVTVKESMDGAMAQVRTQIIAELRSEFEVRDKRQLKSDNEVQELSNNVAKLSDSVANLERRAQTSNAKD